jgi:DNA invertase Pin-like site-specific DNA recombinase
MTGTKLKTKAEPPPENRRLGYARVSTYGQTLESQLGQLRAAGCSSRNIYREKVTGAHNDRRELLNMLKALAPGDVVTVTRIDRLARSTFDLFAIVKQIVDAKAQFRSLAEPWAETGTSTGRLMIAVLGGLADVERDLIRTRTAEGRSRAQKRGQRMGRKPKLTEAQQDEARRRRAEGATLVELARSYGVGKSTISRLRSVID